jgi:hypothetical protein
VSSKEGRDVRNSGLIGVPLRTPLPTLDIPGSSDGGYRLIAGSGYGIISDCSRGSTRCGSGILGMLNGLGREADGIEIRLAGMGYGMSRIERVPDSSAHGGL